MAEVDVDAALFKSLAECSVPAAAEALAYGSPATGL